MVAANWLSLSLIFLLIINPGYGQAPILPDEDQKQYYGLYWGASGIAQSLLELGYSGLFEENTSREAINAAKQALNAVWNNRYEEDGVKYPTWSKFARSDIYPGIKYGSAGIAKVFLRAYTLTGNETYHSRSIEIIDELYISAANATSTPHWPYSYFEVRNPLGIAITDIKYGSLGIIDATLDLYEQTLDEKYLDYAIKAANWIYSISGNFTVEGEVGSIMPWYDDEGEGPVFLTPYGQGNAGAIAILDRLSELSDHSFWKEWADFIIKWLISIQHEDGKWAYNALLPDIAARTTRELGVAGIIEALINRGLTTDNELLNTISVGINWLEDQVIKNSTHFLIPQVEGEVNGRYDINNGLAGILRSFRLSNITDVAEITREGYIWLLNNATFLYSTDGRDYRGIYPTALTKHYFDLSYSDGLAGIALELLEVYQANYLPLYNDQILTTLREIIDTLVFYQTNDGLWLRQIALGLDISSETSRSSDTPISIVFVIVSLVFAGKLIRRKF
ncbi:MAG: lanthionine synthetase LanC family protein [Candidatus Kariarchaeaceae archaeon]|jgi:lantibiotic modifying enzyme